MDIYYVVEVTGEHLYKKLPSDCFFKNDIAKDIVRNEFLFLNPEFRDSCLLEGIVSNMTSMIKQDLRSKFLIFYVQNNKQWIKPVKIRLDDINNLEDIESVGYQDKTPKINNHFNDIKYIVYMFKDGKSFKRSSVKRAMEMSLDIKDDFDSNKMLKKVLDVMCKDRIIVYNKVTDKYIFKI